jgi:hypothetical protein
MSVSYPLPGTKFYERVKNQLESKQNWQDSQDLAMLYKGPYTTAFYRKLHIVLHQEFRARRTWDMLKRVLRHPTSLRRRHARQAATMIYQWLTLPVQRARLQRLAQAPHQGLGSLPRTMTPDEAARPSPQME